MKRKSTIQPKTITTNPTLPAPYRKAWKINNHIAFTWRERIKILFLGQVQFETVVMSERMPGRMEGKIAKVEVKWLEKEKFENVGTSEPSAFSGMLEIMAKDDINKLRSIPSRFAKKAMKKVTK